MASAVQYLFKGLSTDTKPTPTTNPELNVGSRFVAVDTGASFDWNGTAWMTSVATATGDPASSGGGAVTVADGADVTQGAKGNAAATDSTSSWSVVALLKGILAKLLGTIGVTGTFWQATQPVSIASLPALVAGTALIGSTLPKHGTKSAPTAVTPTTSATSCLVANSGRIKALIVNNGTQTVYLGVSSGVTSSNGIPVAAGGSIEDDASTDVWFAIVASGTGDLRILEIS